MVRRWAVVSSGILAAMAVAGCGGSSSSPSKTTTTTGTPGLPASSSSSSSASSGGTNVASLDDAAKCIHITVTSITGVTEPPPATETRVTDVSDPSLSFQHDALAAHNFKGAVRRLFARGSAAPDNPDVNLVNYAVTAYLFGSSADATGFLTDYDKLVTSKGSSPLTKTGTQKTATIYQNADHVDVLWPSGNAVIRVNAGGSDKFSQSAASTDDLKLVAAIDAICPM